MIAGGPPAPTSLISRLAKNPECPLVPLAQGGLQPASADRLRGAFPHLEQPLPGAPTPDPFFLLAFRLSIAKQGRRPDGGTTNLDSSGGTCSNYTNVSETGEPAAWVGCQ
jgi:hypothetical protein